MDGKEYRAKVGPPELFDLIGAHQFCVMVKMGLREYHTMIDLGCGCLRGGRFFINYLQPGHYVGIEPDEKLLEYGVAFELTEEVDQWKAPMFYHWDDFVFAGRLGHQYDFVLAQSILTHAGPDIVRLIMSESYRALKPGGKFVATFFDGLSNTMEPGWFGNGIARYKPDCLRGIAVNLGYEYLVERELGHPRGQAWLEAKK